MGVKPPPHSVVGGVQVDDPPEEHVSATGRPSLHISSDFGAREKLKRNAMKLFPNLEPWAGVGPATICRRGSGGQTTADQGRKQGAEG